MQQSSQSTSSGQSSQTYSNMVHPVWPGPGVTPDPAAAYFQRETGPLEPQTSLPITNTPVTLQTFTSHSQPFHVPMLTNYPTVGGEYLMAPGASPLQTLSSPYPTFPTNQCTTSDQSATPPQSFNNHNSGSLPTPLVPNNRDILYQYEEVFRDNEKAQPAANIAPELQSISSMAPNMSYTAQSMQNIVDQAYEGFLAIFNGPNLIETAPNPNSFSGVPDSTTPPVVSASQGLLLSPPHPTQIFSPGSIGTPELVGDILVRHTPAPTFSDASHLYTELEHQTFVTRLPASRTKTQYQGKEISRVILGGVSGPDLVGGLKIARQRRSNEPAPYSRRSTNSRQYQHNKNESLGCGPSSGAPTTTIASTSTSIMMSTKEGEGENKRFVCPGDALNPCGKRYGRKDHLMRHINSFHLSLKPCQCEECGFSCSRIDNLKQHKATHKK